MDGDSAQAAALYTGRLGAGQRSREQMYISATSLVGFGQGCGSRRHSPRDQRVFLELQHNWINPVVEFEDQGHVEDYQRALENLRAQLGGGCTCGSVGTWGWSMTPEQASLSRKHIKTAPR